MLKHIIHINPQYLLLSDIITRIIKYGVPSEARIIYNGRRNKVYALDIDGHSLNIKAFRCPNIINAVAYTTLRQSKARRSFDNASQLISLGLDSPTPIAYGECRRGRLLKQSYYISQQITAEDMRDWEQKADCEQLLRALAGQIVKLHQAGVWHKDFSPGNILYTGNATDGYHFSYIDLNRMAFGISDRQNLMSMFRSINLNRAETERLGRYYAMASGQDVDIVVDQVRKAQDAYFATRRRKQRIKKILKFLKLR